MVNRTTFSVEDNSVDQPTGGTGDRTFGSPIGRYSLCCQTKNVELLETNTTISRSFNILAIAIALAHPPSCVDRTIFIRFRSAQ